MNATMQTMADIVAREKRKWVTCLGCGVTMHGVYFPTHPCGTKRAPILDERRFQRHADMVESDIDQLRRGR